MQPQAKKYETNRLTVPVGAGVLLGHIRVAERQSMRVVPVSRREQPPPAKQRVSIMMPTIYSMDATRRKWRMWGLIDVAAFVETCTMFDRV